MKRNSFGDNATVFPTAVEQWRSLAEQYGNAENVPPVLILAVIWKESGGDPSATGDSGLAHGLMQMHEPAAQDVDPLPNAEHDLYDPETAIRLGAKYLSWCYNRSQTWLRALQAYNGGLAHVLRADVSVAAQDYANDVHAKANGDQSA